MTSRQEQIQQFNISKTIPEDTTKETKDNGQKEDTKTDAQKIISKQAEQTPAKRASDEKEAEREQEQLQQERDNQDTLNKLGNKIAEGQEAIANTASPFVQWLGKQPTPGGVLTVFAILLFFLFAIVPVNERGDTRLKLIWLTLTSKTKLSYNDEGKIIGGGGNFNVTPPVTNTIVPGGTQTIASQTIEQQPQNGNGFIPLLDNTAFVNFLSFGE